MLLLPVRIHGTYILEEPFNPLVHPGRRCTPFVITSIDLLRHEFWPQVMPSSGDKTVVPTRIVHAVNLSAKAAISNILLIADSRHIESLSMPRAG